ncbi:alkaline phosphatase family protein [Patescibacteria group bacterium]
MADTKVIVIGLDCATPQLMFDKYKEDLPNIAKFMEQGTWGPLKSTIPPITVPAWAAMTTSKTAGDLGVYGFRSRKPGSDYNDMDIAHARLIKEKRVWEYLGDAGKKVGLLGVPQTYPPSEVNGMMVTSFLTPGSDVEFTYPAELKQEILDMVAPDDYIFDFANRSKDPPDKVLETIYKMTDQRQKIMKHWVENKEWDFLMMVEMGVDRIHHYLWHFMDPEHKDYEPGNPFEDKIKEYYKHIDTFIGELLELAPEGTIFYVVSDHGAKKMEGMFVINEWLIENGYLTVKDFPSEPTSIQKLEVDWSKTKAWAWGGFYGRLFLNVKGREPQGIVEPGEVDGLLEEIRSKLLEVKGPKGEDIKTQIHRPQELYPGSGGDAPDLMLFWGDLFWKVAGTLGWNSLYIEQDDRGLDFGVHDWDGVFAKYDPNQPGQGKRDDLDIMDFSPEVLKDFGLDIPSDFRGKTL